MEGLVSTQHPDGDPIDASYTDCLRKHFGHSNFRPMQWKIISSILERKQDTLAIMATGYGKSLCFQFPSVYLETVTLVISPLISLMEDQVLSLTISNIKACMLGSAQTNKSIYSSVLDGDYRLVYMTPELLTSDFGATMLKKLEPKLTVIAIDEAHCISKWGHDFRAAFRQLGIIRKTVPRVPILAVTATATQQVQQDIVRSLAMRNAQVLCTGFDRANLSFNVSLKSNHGIWADIGPLLRLVRIGSTIIYCLTRKQTEEIAELLKQNGINCEAYHAGLSINQRKLAHQDFVRDKVRVIAATIAFGMGIDKPDVRQVIHYGASKDLESYYQEVGRAGRDGLAAKCHMFYNNGDFQLHADLRAHQGAEIEKNLATLAMNMRQYINTSDCRRWFILQYFEGPRAKPTPEKNCCDNCRRVLIEGSLESKYEGLDNAGRYDFAKDAELLLASVNVFNGTTGLTIPILFLRGSKSQKINSKYYEHHLFGKGQNKSESWWKSLACLLEEQKFLQKKNYSGAMKTFRSMQTVMLTQKADDWLASEDGKILLLKVPKDMQPYLKVKRTEVVLTTPYTSKLVRPAQESKKSNQNAADEKVELMKALFKVRNSLASELNIMPYIVCSNQALSQLAQLKPSTIAELQSANLDGFSDMKISKFGPRFIAAILQFTKFSSSTRDSATIQDFLREHPIADVKITPAYFATLDLWKSGNSIKQIAQLRGISESTVSSYLAALIKAGYLSRMDIKKLGVDDQMFAHIASKLQEEDIENLKLAPLKGKCSPNVTWDKLRYVVSYCQLEHHIKLKGGDISKFQAVNESSVADDASESQVQDCPTNSTRTSNKPDGKTESRSHDNCFDSDSDVDFTQIEIPNEYSFVEKKNRSDSIEEVENTLEDGNKSQRPEMLHVADLSKVDNTTIISDSEDSGKVELDELILAIKNDENRELQNSESADNYENDESKKTLKRKQFGFNEVVFLDSSSSSDDEVQTSKNRAPTCQSSWLSKKPGRKMMKAFKSDF